MFKTKNQSFLRHLEKHQKQLKELGQFIEQKKTKNWRLFKLICGINQNQKIVDVYCILEIEDMTKEQENMLKNNSVVQYRLGYLLWILTQNKSQLQLKQKQEKNDFKNIFAQIISFLKMNKLTYSFDQNIFTKQKSGFGYNPLYDDYPKSSSNKLPTEMLQKCEPFGKLMKFLQKTQLLDQNSQINQKFKRIGQQSYKLQYLKQYCFFQPLEQKLFPNCQFYTNMRKHPSQRLSIDGLFYQKQTDYAWLQRCHNYIQWLFPNHFKSGFNDDCFPLSYLEAEIFKKDLQIGRRMIKSIEIYLDFMGTEIRYSSNKQVNFSKVLGGQKRLEDVLINYTHNHLRLMRILACLSITGFRLIAVELIRFLDQLTLNETKYKRIRKVFQSKWQIYDDKMKQKAFQMCFLQAEQFPPLHQALNQKFSSQKNHLRNIGQQKQIKSEVYSKKEENNRKNQKVAKSQFKMNQIELNRFKKQSNIYLTETQSKNNQNSQNLKQQNLQDQLLQNQQSKINQNQVQPQNQKIFHKDQNNQSQFQTINNHQNSQSQFQQSRNSQSHLQQKNKSKAFEQTQNQKKMNKMRIVSSSSHKNQSQNKRMQIQMERMIKDKVKDNNKPRSIIESQAQSQSGIFSCCLPSRSSTLCLLI